MLHELIGKGAVVSAYALDGKGLAAAVSKMAFGNKLGVTIEKEVSEETLFAPGFGNIVAGGSGGEGWYCQGGIKGSGTFWK